jgi:single-stranded-DNA-specific exonuclease
MTMMPVPPATPRASRLPLVPRRWVERAVPADAAAAQDRIAQELNLPAALGRLLMLRGHSDVERAKRFLKPRLDQMHDPGALADMDAAVTRLRNAVRAGETILVHGDYDVDGICAATMLTRVIRTLGGRAEAFVPHRMKDGYDLGPAGVHAAAQAGARVIVTADCGTVAFDAVRAARAAGIDVIITDHHTPSTILPEALAVVNPNRPDCGYPYKGLAGVGVAYKLCQALVAELGADPEFLRWHLDLVALATIADLAPLTGENRIFAAYGLRVLAQTRNPGLRALMSAAEIDTGNLSAGQVSHVLAPRINAVGRLGEAGRGVRLLLAEDEAEAQALARTMEDENRTRRTIDRETLRHALSLLERDYDAEKQRGIVLAAQGWHPGVIGIVASRVVERIHRPTVLIAIEPNGERARGSARSIPGFDLYEAIHACSALLERFGGHRQAAGLELRPDRIDAFRDAFDTHARSVLHDDDLIALVNLDHEVRLSGMDFAYFDLQRHFGPFGIGNPSPTLVARGVRLAEPPRLVGDGHVRLLLEQDGAQLSAIGFGMADALGALVPESARLDVAFQLQDHTWRERRSLQARLIDVRPAA